MSANMIKLFYLTSLSIMKKILSLYEYRVGRDSEEYKYFKQQIMDFFYNELTRLFNDLTKQGYLENCTCGAVIRKGYSKCEHCGGSGYKIK